MCQEDARYFAAWENGYGPGQKVPGDEPVPNTSKHVQKKKEEIAELGRRLWVELHDYSQQGEWSSSEAEKWLAKWTQRVPAYGCNCRNHWKSIVRNHPADFSSEEAFRRWAIDRHNDVNKKLRKPEYQPPEVTSGTRTS